MNRYLTYEERSEIGSSLSEHHSVFYEFWKMVKPKFSDQIPTACVSLNKENKCLEFLINKKFWDESNDEKKAFLVSHECSHLLQSAGKRTNGKCDEAKNVALDIPVNESLVKYFGFNRKNIDPDSHFCWLDTIFPDKNASAGKSFEFYYDLLKQQGRLKPAGKKGLFNDHSGIPGQSSEDGLEEFLDSLIDNLDEASADSLKEILNREQAGQSQKEEEGGEKAETDPKKSGKQAGDGHAGIIKRIEKKFVKKKPKWETVIKKWLRKFVNKDFEVNHWLIRNRRFTLLPHELMLPNDIDTDDRQKDKEKIQVFVAMDYSSSCVHHAARFYKAFDSIPKNIKVRLFSFDTYCTELDKKERQIVGGGGTTFSCIERKIQEIIKAEKIKYPWVFCLTDGIAQPFQPEKPKNWIFLLTEDYRYCIPDGAKIYDLREFE
jgi:hypothetical protein